MRSAAATRRGVALGSAVCAAAHLADYRLPLAGIRLYQLVPPAARLRLFGGPSTSHATAAAIREAGAGGWQLIVRGIQDNKVPRPAMPPVPGR